MEVSKQFYWALCQCYESSISHKGGSLLSSKKIQLEKSACAKKVQPGQGKRRMRTESTLVEHRKTLWSMRVLFMFRGTWHPHGLKPPECHLYKEVSIILTT